MRCASLGRALGVVLMASCLVLAACGGANKGEYVKANQAILDQLPTYGGSTVESRTDNPYYITEQGPASGYTTNVVYRVPADVTDDDVIGFYVGQLGDTWQHCEEQLPVRAVVPAAATPAPPLGFVKNVSFFRAGAEVAVNADGLSPASRSNTYEIAVDHEASHNPCTGEDLK